jgi:hypothetical protein
MCECEVTRYRFPETNAQVMQWDMPTGVKLAVVVLRKVFLQAGRGRKMSALERGISSDSRSLVAQVVSFLTDAGFVVSRGKDPIVFGVRSRAGDVRCLLKERPDIKSEMWRKLAEMK